MTRKRMRMEKVRTILRSSGLRLKELEGMSESEMTGSTGGH